jgi:acetyltransferase
VEYGTGGKANPASLVRSISRLPPGPGYKILDILIGIAQEKRLERILGIVLTESRRMLYLCCKSAFKAEQLPEGLDRVELVLR